MDVEPSLYTILGVDPRATADDIRRAFRRLAHAVHPDASLGPEADASRFREIRRAYEVLSDPSSRREYDASLRLARGGRRIEIHDVATRREDSGAAATRVCSTCGDTRRILVVDRCPSCDSTGTIVELNLSRAVRRLCSTCAGRGRVRRPVPCPTCGAADRPV